MANKPIAQEELQGCFTALATPIRDGMIDHDKLEKMVEAQVLNGNGILACGTTSQAWDLPHNVHVALANNIYQMIKGRVPFMVSTGSNSTREAIKMSQDVERRIGPTTFLSVTPYYNKPGVFGQIKHFTKIANSIEGNVVLYNVPSRVGIELRPKVVIELSQNPNIIGLKQALDFTQGEGFDHTQEIIENADLRVLSGEDHYVPEMINMGGYGVISASANIAPKIFHDLVNEHSKELEERAINIANLVFASSNPVPIAAVLNSEVFDPLDLRDNPEGLRSKMLEYSKEELGIDLKYFE